MTKQLWTLPRMVALVLTIGGCATPDQEEDDAAAPTQLAVRESALEDEIETVVVTAKRPRAMDPIGGGGGSVGGSPAPGPTSGGGGGGRGKAPPNKALCESNKADCRNRAVAIYDVCLNDVVNLAIGGVPSDIIIERKNRCATDLDANVKRCSEAAVGC